MYICEICNKELLCHKYQFKEHIDKCIESLKIYTCKICKKTFKSKKLYDKHILNCKNKKYICKTCKLEFKIFNELRSHVNSKHGKINNKKYFKCEICGKELFTNAGGFKSHFNNHNQEWKKIKDKNIKLAKEEFFNDEERSKEYLEGLSKRMTGFKHSSETKKKISKSVKNYMSNLSDEEYSKVVMNYINAPLRGNIAGHPNQYEPTRPEQMIIDLNIEGLIYNGNKKDAKIIRFQNTSYRKTSVPDFFYKDTNKLIEVFGNYWHPKEHEELYLNACKENGYELLILWEDEIYNNFKN